MFLLIPKWNDQKAHTWVNSQILQRELTHVSKYAIFFRIYLNGNINNNLNGNTNNINANNINGNTKPHFINFFIKLNNT